MKKKIIIVGGGSAGIITATFLKTYWQDSIDIDLIYDHSKPGIGVGESLTPMIYNYLNYIGVSSEDLIKNVNATIKIGLKFKNWQNNEKYFIHSFYEPGLSESLYNLGPAYDIINKKYDHDATYGDYWYKNNRVPFNYNIGSSIHIDATLFSKYIENKFKEKLNIIDDTVENVITKDGKNIDFLKLKKIGLIKGDFYIDASGFQAVLFNKIKNEWVDKSDWLPVNKCIPNPLSWEFKENLPPYTTAEATDQGWILQVPLQNRWGTGYIYSDNFISDDKAFNNFEYFIQKTYNTKLTNNSRIIKFNSGYWKKQWVGNCLAVGLAGGFAEPLEATNIHHTIYQTMKFINLFNGEVLQNDIEVYNESINDLYENIYLFIRFCYSTNRIDSNFWRFLTNNIPPEVKNLEEKISKNILTESSFNKQSKIFTHSNFTKIAYGLGKIDYKQYNDILSRRRASELGRQESDKIKEIKTNNILNSIDHLDLIKQIKNS